jgi:Methyltransferase domain
MNVLPLATFLTSFCVLIVLLVFLVKVTRWKSAILRRIHEVNLWTREVRAWNHLSEQAREPGYLPWSGYAIGAESLLRVLSELTRMSPELVVEFGSGLSTIEIGRALAKLPRGHLLSFEHDEEWARMVERKLALLGLAANVTVVHAPLEPTTIRGSTFTWYSEPAVSGAIRGRRIGVMLVDGPPGNSCHLARYPALPVLYENLAPDAVVFLDDASRAEEAEISARWSREFHLDASIRGGLHGVAVLRRPGAEGSPPERSES